MKVAICAGHGYNTAGKRTPDDEREWAFNDKVVRATIATLEANGVRVLRTDDPTGRTDVGLTARTNAANNWGADVYVSVHHNAMSFKWFDGSGGVETYTQAGSQPDSERLAREVHGRIVKAMDLRDRGMKKANFAITRQTRMPAILTEGGFMDSRTDIKAMRDDTKLKAQGEAIAEGVLAYFGVKKTASAKPQTGGTQVTAPSKPAPAKPATSKPSTSGLLQRGSKGKDVKALQDQLLSLGYKLPRFGADSDFGVETENAVKAFQRDQGIAVDGIAGPDTFSKLAAAIKSKSQTQKEYVSLPASAATWRTYRTNVQPVAKNSDWSLTPKAFGGLEYVIIGKPQKDVVTINTSRGKRNIYVASSTGARIFKK